MPRTIPHNRVVTPGTRFSLTRAALKTLETFTNAVGTIARAPVTTFCEGVSGGGGGGDVTPRPVRETRAEGTVGGGVVHADVGGGAPAGVAGAGVRGGVARSVAGAGVE